MSINQAPLVSHSSAVASSQGGLKVAAQLNRGESMEDFSEIEKLSTEGSGESKKLSSTHRSDGNCMFYALWEAGLDADTAATLRKSIFEEKNKTLREKCANIEQKIKNDINQRRQEVENCIKKIIQSGVKITDKDGNSENKYTKDSFKGLKTKNIDAALKYIQDNNIDTVTSADADIKGIKNVDLKQILTALGLGKTKFFDQLGEGKSNFAQDGHSNTIRNLCNGLIDLNQAKCSENQVDINYDTLFQAVDEAFPTTSIGGAINVIDVLRGSKNLDKIKAVCEPTKLANRNGKVSPIIQGLLMEVLSVASIRIKNSYVEAENLALVAKLIDRPILLLNADAATRDIDGNAVECSLYEANGSTTQCKIDADGKIFNDTVQVNLENNTLVIAKTAVHFFGPPSFKGYGRQLKVGEKCITGFSSGAFKFEDDSKLSNGGSEGTVAAITTMSNGDISDVVERLKENHIHYFSTRGDSVWRLIHTSKNNDVIRALAMTHMAFALPNSVNFDFLEQRECKTLGTVPDPARRLECDACISVSADKSGSTTSENVGKTTGKKRGRKSKSKNAAPELLTGAENIVAADITKRGAVIFAEMQQKKIAEKSIDDNLPFRLDNYGSGLAHRDWGLQKSKNEKGNGRKKSSIQSESFSNVDDIHGGKMEEDIVSRSVIGVGYQGYGGVAIRNWSDLHVLSGMSKGKALATVSIGEAKEYARSEFLEASGKELDEGKIRNEIDNLKEKVAALFPSLVEKSKQLVSEVFTVFTMSHLFTKNIVAKFLPVVQTLCEILEVNMDTMKKVGLSPEDYEALYGPSLLKQELVFYKGESLFYKIKSGDFKKSGLTKEEKELLGNYEKQLAERHVSSEFESQSSSDEGSPGWRKKPRGRRPASQQKQRARASSGEKIVYEARQTRATQRKGDNKKNFILVT
ncbi:MAG: hypothetical protein LBI81_03430 [Puniceicoccales bacterium]|nr:hypothetical protein [Puniceicoccales bacterium]